MSQETNPNIAAPDEISVATPATETPSPVPAWEPSPVMQPEPKAAWRMFIAPAWFLLGILVGLAAFAGYDQLTPKPVASVVQQIDEATIKKAAREGLVEAIQSLQAQAQSQGNSSQGPQAVDKNAFAIRPANLLGDKNAKVSIVEFADFQCPYCERHFNQVEPAIIQTYVNTGKVNMVYKHLAFLGQESVDAAIASECAADQNKFWEYHNYLYAHQNGENQGAFTKPKLLDFGKALSLEMTAFEKCLTNDETIARVQADSAEAQQFGVASTPTFFVNGKPLVGLISPAEFQAAIDQALSQ